MPHIVAVKQLWETHKDWGGAQLHTLYDEIDVTRQRMKEQQGYDLTHAAPGLAWRLAPPVWSQGQCRQILGMLELRRELALRLGECNSSATLLTAMAKHGHQALDRKYWERVGNAVGAAPEAQRLWLDVNRSAERLRKGYRRFINQRDYIRAGAQPVEMMTADGAYRATATQSRCTRAIYGSGSEDDQEEIGRPGLTTTGHTRECNKLATLIQVWTEAWRTLLRYMQARCLRLAQDTGPPPAAQAEVRKAEPTDMQSRADGHAEPS